MFLLLLAAYFVLQIVIRLSLSDALDLDEAEQAFIFQQLRAGYDSQPPLYAGLQWLSFSLFGLNLFALSLLKNLLLFLTYAGVLLTARPLIGAKGAMAATASLVLMPAIGWESQRDLTHSVLLTTMASLTLLSYFALLRRPDVWRYLLFGLAIGMGLQSKYNFAILVGGLMVASLAVPEHRRIVWNSKVAITAVVALLCLVPHGLWLLHHLDDAARGTLSKMSEGRQHAYLLNVVTGFGSLLEATLAFVTPLWLIYAWLCRRDFRQASVDWKSANARFFLTLLAFIFAALTLMLLFGRITNIKSRWLLPFLFFAPLAFFVVLPKLARPEIFHRILQIACCFALVISLALPLRVYVGPMLGKNVRAHYPFAELSVALHQQFPQIHTVISDAKLTAGNLHFQRPELRTLLMRELLTRPQPLQGDLLLVVRGESAPDALQRFRSVYPLTSVQQIGRINLKMGYGSAETMSFDFVHITVRNQ